MLSFLIAVSCLVGSGAGMRAAPPETVDMIELNHKYCDQTGRHQFDQLIFWKWSPDYRRFDVVGWALVDEHNHLRNMPEKQGKWYTCEAVLYRMYGARVRFRARLFRETHTDYDPEAQNRKLNPLQRELNGAL